MKEADLKATIENYLIILQNQGKLVYNRQNSGEVLVSRGDKKYKINLCQTGTPDFIVHKDGRTFYLEAKGDKGKVSQEQIVFARELDNQHIETFLVWSIEAVLELINDSDKGEK